MLLFMRISDSWAHLDAHRDYRTIWERAYQPMRGAYVENIIECIWIEVYFPIYILIDLPAPFLYNAGSHAGIGDSGDFAYPYTSCPTNLKADPPQGFN